MSWDPQHNCGRANRHPQCTSCDCDSVIASDSGQRLVQKQGCRQQQPSFPDREALLQYSCMTGTYRSVMAPVTATSQHQSHNAARDLYECDLPGVCENKHSECNWQAKTGLQKAWRVRMQCCCVPWGKSRPPWPARARASAMLGSRSPPVGSKPILGSSPCQRACCTARMPCTDEEGRARCLHLCFSRHASLQHFP